MADLTSISTWRNMFTKHGSKMGWGLVLLFGIPMIFAFGLSGYQKDRSPVEKNANTDETVMKVGDKTITRAEVNNALALVTRGQPLQPGLQMAQAQSQAVESAVQQAIIRKIADERNVHPADVDVDKAMAQFRESLVGKDASDADWRAAVVRASGGKSVSEVRQEQAQNTRLLVPALIKSYENEVKVTDQDVRNQHAQVRFTSILIPAQSDAPAPMLNSKTKPLSDADAKKKAEDLLAKAKAGADIAALAKANSTGGNGDSGLRPEYGDNAQMGLPASMGTFYNGKDFDEAIHKTANGGFTDVVKATGFSPGYVFAKVIERKIDLPKDFDAAKEMTALRSKKAGEKLEADVKKGMETAKVDVLDPNFKAYYDYGKLKQDQYKLSSHQGDGPMPTKEQVDAQEKAVAAEFDAYNKRDPKDATVALVLAEFLKKQQDDPKTPQPQKDALRDRLQTLYETALVSTEDPGTREALAAIYHSKNLNDKAAEQYTKESTILEASGFADAQTAQQAQQTHLKLATELTALGKPDLAAKERETAAKDAGQAANLQAQQAAQQAAQQRQQAEEAKAAKAAADAAKKGGAKAGSPVTPGATLSPTGGATPGTPIQITPGGAGSTPPITVTPQGK